MDKNPIEIYKNFTYLISNAADESDFEIDFNYDVLKDVNYDNYSKLDEFIKFTLETYPIYYNNILEKRVSNIKQATIDEDKRLKKKFIHEVKYSISEAADTLLRKNIRHNNDEIINEINNFLSKSISKLNVKTKIQDDINFFLKIKSADKLLSYLLQEILRRIEDRNRQFNMKVEIESNKSISLEKEFLYKQLHILIKNGESVEKFWNNF